MLFDAHLHIFEPAFPLPGNQGSIPEPFTVEDYRRRTASLGVVGGAVVAASTQGEDPQPLLAAARALGEGFVVIAAAHPGQDDATFAALAASGVRGLRFTLYRGAAFDVPAMLAHARAAAAHGLHAELYADAATLAPHVDDLASLPAGLVLDHLGRTGGAAGDPRARQGRGEGEGDRVRARHARRGRGACGDRRRGSPCVDGRHRPSLDARGASLRGW